MASGAPPLTAIARRIREREIQRQLRQNRARKAAFRLRAGARTAAAERVPTLPREYLETLLGSLLVFTAVFELLARLGGVSPLYTLPAFGVVYASQSSYYKLRLTLDPDFAIPSCGCAGRRHDGSADVLRSRHSTILGVPSSLLAVLFFGAVLGLTAAGEPGPLPALAAFALAASAYLGYVMLARVRSLCSICINIAALNVLIFWQVLA